MADNIKKKGGRPNKHGMKYNPVYATLFTSSKMQKAEDMVDPSGKNMDDRLLVDKMVMRFFNYIFSRGYYIHWNEDAEKDLCKEIGNGMNPIRLRIYLKAILDVEFINSSMYKQYGILTSRGLQQNWIHAMKTARREKIVIDDRYFIESDKNDYLRDGTVIASRRNKGKLPKKHVINTQPTDINTQKNDNTGFPSEITGDPSGNNTSNTPNQGGVSFYSNSNTLLSSNTGIGNNKDNIIINKVPEETGNSSGSNANNSGVYTEQTNTIPKNNQFVPEETNNSSVINYEMEIPLNSQVIYPIETCKWNYLHNNKYERTIHQHIIQLSALRWLENDKSLLEAWLDAFNRSNIDENIYERPFNGTHGYAKHFKNWVNKRPDYLNTDPNTLFINTQYNGNQRKTDNEPTGSGNPKKSNERIGSVKRESVDRLREAKGMPAGGNTAT